MEEIKLDMKNLTKEEREQLLKLVEKANKKGKVWKPEFAEAYKVIDDCGAIYTSMWGISNDEIVDRSRYNIGNCFKTDREAEFALEKIHITTRLEDFARKYNDEFRGCKYYLATNKSENGSYYVEIDSHYENIVSQYAREYPMPSFSSRSVALKAVAEIGEENLLRYYFQVI